MRYDRISGAIDWRVAPDTHSNTSGLHRSDISLSVGIGWNPVFVDSVRWERKERPVRCTRCCKGVEINQRIDVDWPGVRHRITHILCRTAEGLSHAAPNGASHRGVSNLIPARHTLPIIVVCSTGHCSAISCIPSRRQGDTVITIPRRVICSRLHPDSSSADCQAG